MQNKNAGIRLVVSDKMGPGKPGEQGLIRLPKRTRQHHGLSPGATLALTAGEQQVFLQVNNAYTEDSRNLTVEIAKGEITREEACITCFVSPEIFCRVTTDSKKAYISDGVGNILIGGDPEFAIVDPETLTYKYAEHLTGLSLEDELGHDGPLVEVRPPPTLTPAGLVANIKTILQRDAGKLNPYLWRSGASYKSPNPTARIVHIGGHIQFGNPRELPEDQKNSIYKQTVRVLDETVALALVKVDTPMPHHRRNEKWGNYGRYGRWGDYRVKEGRFEWRVPSGLWLSHPTFATAVLGASKAVVESCLQDMADKSFNDEWICARVDRKGFLKSRKVSRIEDVQGAINSADPNTVSTSLLDGVAKKLRSLDNYSKYKAEIDEFLSLVRMTEKDQGRLNLDVRDTWLAKGSLFVRG